MLLIHHEGKSGEQRGTNLKIFSADTVIKLTLPKDENTSSETRSIEFEKARHLSREQKRTLEVRLSLKNSKKPWILKKVNKNEQNEKIIEMSKQGYKEQEIADSLGLSKPTVQRRRKELKLTKPRKPK